MSLSCLPCAKRKVRCDRAKPCSHCRRRRGDICEYPSSPGDAGINSRRIAFDKQQAERIANLEDFIRALGHDPDGLLLSSPPTSRIPKRSLEPNDAIPIKRGLCNSVPDTHLNGTSSDVRASSNISDQAKLVENDSQTTYIEAPMWYSWSEASRQAEDSSKPMSLRHEFGYSSTLIECFNQESSSTLYQRHPSSSEIHELWKRFLSNVHPITKLFFEWEKDTLLRKTAENVQSLSEEEHAFTSAIYLITILSFSDEDCEEVMGDPGKSQILNDFQSFTEAALFAADFVATSSMLVLQAFLLYLLAIRNRTRPAVWYSLMGIAVRIAQRIGLHRDGNILKLPAARTEERRRVWWQMQQMEIMAFQMTGCASLSLYADWDTKLPANLDDHEIHLGLETLPHGHQGLTSMSHCLYRYDILNRQRTNLDVPKKDFAWLTSPHTAHAEKEALFEECSRRFGEKYIQHCDLLNPLHVSIQIGIRSFLLALRRIILQPGVSNPKISSIPKPDRDTFLKSCIESLEYYLLGEMTPSIAQFRWYNEIYFQWNSFVYIIVEAHHRAASAEVISLWTLINKICTVHPKLTVALRRPDIVAIGRLIILAWHQREEFLLLLNRSTEKPWCVRKMEEELDHFLDSSVGGARGDFMSLDLDMIDWSTWEQNGYVQALK